MIVQLKRYLVTIPTIAILLFFIFNSVAAYLYPGCTKEVINYHSDHYSFTHNFLSGLGSMQTNTDNVNKAIERLDNTPSMLLFNGSLVIIGFAILMFYFFFQKFFVFVGDNERSIKLARYVKPFGMLAGVFYAGVGLVPHDLHFGWHVFFAHGAFSLLLIVCSLHALAVYHSKKLNNAYAFGYLLFCFFLATYLCIIFLGPEIGPNRVYSESDLILQVVAQKMIVLTFICSILIQIHGIKKVLFRIA